MSNAAGPLNLLGLAILGLALHVAVRILYSRRDMHTPDLIRVALQVMSGVLVMISLLAVITSLTSWFAIIILVLLLLNGLMAWLQFLRLEKQAVLNYLAVAVERGLPLTTAAQAYALERGDWLGKRSLRLADALESGIRLPGALRASGHRFGVGPTLAIGVGDDLRCLSTTLSRISSQENTLHAAMRRGTDLLAYASVVTSVLLATTLFLTIRVVPRLERMASEFGVPLPRATQWFFDTTNRFAQGPSLVVVVGIFSVTILGLLLISGLAYFEVWSRWLPGAGHLCVDYDRAWLLRALAWGVSSGHPVHETLSSIQRHLPPSLLRPRLAQALRNIEQGVPWVEALRSSRVLGPAPCAILESAERVGNLAWACEQRADSQLRWFAVRLRAAISLAYPMLVLLLGSAAMFFAVSLFSLLIDLIHWLA